MLTATLCLAVAIFFEARDQPIEGQRAVAEVILNRVADSQWPDNVCDVVEQHKQFSFTHDGMSDDPLHYKEPDAWITALLVAKSTLAGIDLIGITSTYYHATYAHPYWHESMQLDGQIGDHLFYSK